jgi:hypothetical protein
MPVSNNQVATLRAFLTRNPDRYQRLHGELNRSERQPCRGAVGHGHRDRAVQFDDWRAGHVRPHQGIANDRPLQPLPVPLAAPDQIGGP